MTGPAGAVSSPSYTRVSFTRYSTHTTAAYRNYSRRKLIEDVVIKHLNTNQLAKRDCLARWIWFLMTCLVSTRPK
jgi:hypothetical protein